MVAENDIKRIKEFFYLLDNDKMEVVKFSKPVLVYEIKDDKIFYSLWEEEILDKYGLKNVDGWDYEDSIFFAPDWLTEKDD